MTVFGGFVAGIFVGFLIGFVAASFFRRGTERPTPQQRDADQAELRG